MTDKPFKNCQSCSMPLVHDKRGGGTNADGSKSTMYCSYCFADGGFTLPELTLEQMQERVRARLRQLGLRGFIALLFFVRKIPKLRRWRR